jgi:BlaI family transcriptional regulator, penicillinase repressor
MGIPSASPLSQPTEVELQILRVLWDLGPSPVRDIHGRLAAEKGTNYSTTVKMLAVMLDKGLVKRDETLRPHVYRAAVTQDRVRKRMVGSLVDRLYHGSAMSLVLQMLSSKPATKEELAEIRRLLDRLEGKSP